MKYLSIVLLSLSAVANADIEIHQCVLAELENEGYKDTKLDYDQSFLDKAVALHKKQIEAVTKMELKINQPKFEDSVWYLIKLSNNSWVIRSSNCHIGENSGVTTVKTDSEKSKIINQ